MTSKTFRFWQYDHPSDQALDDLQLQKITAAENLICSRSFMLFVVRPCSEDSNRSHLSVNSALCLDETSTENLIEAMEEIVTKMKDFKRAKWGNL